MFWKERKRGQGAVGAAILIAVVALLIVFYLLLVPPEEREALLEEKNITVAKPPAEEKILLDVSPGRLHYIAEKTIEHPISSVELDLWSESTVLKERDSVYVSSTIFGKKRVNISFDVKKEDVENAFVVFDVAKAKGRLIIKVNGVEVLNKYISTPSIEPLRITEFLRDGKNVIEFYAGGVGFAFWRKNKYQLLNVKIIADMLRREKQEARQVFIMTPEERENLEKVIVRFIPLCKQEDVGKLVVKLNDHTIFDAVPDCNSMIEPIELTRDYVNIGENVVYMRTEKGRFLIDRFMVASKIGKVEYPTYYFDLSAEQYDAITSGQKNAILTIRFRESVERKIGKVIVNGHYIGIDQKESDFVAKINDYVVRGSNAVQIVPSRTLDVVALIVELS